jgi:hypothetical protein
MGIEYKLEFSCSDPAELRASLLRVLGAGAAADRQGAVEFRHEIAEKGGPDATVVVEPYGLYFCDHGGHGRDYLGRVVAIVTSEFGPVSVSELE